MLVRERMMARVRRMYFQRNLGSSAYICWREGRIGNMVGWVVKLSLNLLKKRENRSDEFERNNERHKPIICCGSKRRVNKNGKACRSFGSAMLNVSSIEESNNKAVWQPRGISCLRLRW